MGVNALVLAAETNGLIDCGDRHRWQRGEKPVCIVRTDSNCLSARQRDFDAFAGRDQIDPGARCIFYANAIPPRQVNACQTGDFSQVDTLAPQPKSEMPAQLVAG